MFTKKILAAAITSQPSANGVADAIDFDGTTDYLLRSSDLVGNIDSKTFTFSAWVWPAAANGVSIFTFGTNNPATLGIRSYLSGGRFTIIACDTSGNAILSVTTTQVEELLQTYSHILVSIDLSNTSRRHVFINDVSVAATWTKYGNDNNINFTNPNLYIKAYLNGAIDAATRLAHLYLDHAYRDLSIEANRRLFITADRKPAAGQAALNPILYLPLNDPTQPGKNLGTGGDFALNGVVARSGRGPSQFNAPYSNLDGSADYLSRTSITGITNSNKFTFSCTFNPNVASGGYLIGTYRPGDRGTFFIELASNGTDIRVYGIASDNTVVLNALLTNAITYTTRNHTLTVSIDLTSTTSRYFYVDGIQKNPTWVTYVNSSINFPTSSTEVGSDGSASRKFNGRLGNVFFDTKYIDLSVPANLAKFVTGTGIDAKPADLGANGEKPFGTPPLIYLPMYGNNAGKNYGTGGDFTVNSGPFTGARGPNEFWGNKADFDGSTGYLARTNALSGVSDGKTFSASFSFNTDTTGTTNRAFIVFDDGSTFKFRIGLTNTPQLVVETDANLQGIATTTSINAGTDYFVQMCVDLTSTAKRFIYVNGVAQSVAWNACANSNINFSAPNPKFGYDAQYTWRHDGTLSEFYFTTEYIDFSQEANRLKFRDAFGNPVDLAPQIAAGTLPNPAIYMRFDPANFGKNSGTGGDFTVSGTITDGGQL